VAYFRGLGRIKHLLGVQGTIGRVQMGLSTFREYRRLGINFDVIEYPDNEAQGWVFALLHQLPLVAHLHSFYPFLIHHRELPLIRDILCDGGIPISADTLRACSMEGFPMRRADIITSPSQMLVEKLKEIGWLNGNQTRVLPHPIDWARWERIPPASSSPPVVLYVGRVERHKAPEVLAEAISIIRKKVPKAESHFVGVSNGKREGLPYVDWMKKTFGTLNGNGYQFIGQVPRSQLPNIYARGRVLAVTSCYEAYSMSGVEAMAAGRPVVVTSTTGVAELIREARAGQVISPGDPRALAEALLPFLIDPDYAARMGEKARAHIRENHDPASAAAKREKVFEEAIATFRRH
jgi:glycosyltransferase involved in cell wall biosynthesis